MPTASRDPDPRRQQLSLRLEMLHEDGVLGLPVRGPRLPERSRPGISTAMPSLDELEKSARDCKLCALCEGRTNVVFGVGAPNAELMFIGEAPGRDEDLQGEPFVGRAGQLLTRIIEAMGLRRQDVYIANANKCRPPSNRNPKPEEIEACRPFLLGQVAAVQPRVIVLLGRIAVQSVLGRTESLARLRGEFQEWQGTPVLCTYHPAYLLRNPSAKKFVWEDMKLVMASLARD